MTLSEIISDLISAKEGNKDFALTFEGGSWDAKIGNDGSPVSIGEDGGEYWTGDHPTPEAAVAELKRRVVDDGNKASHAYRRRLIAEDEALKLRIQEERDWQRTDDGVLIKKYGKIRDFIPRQSGLSAPMIIRDGIHGIQSMADGHVYDSKAALRRSYTAEGNPQGRDYTEIGGAEVEPAGMSTPDKKAIRDTVDKALHDVKAGNVPEHIRAIE